MNDLTNEFNNITTELEKEFAQLEAKMRGIAGEAIKKLFNAVPELYMMTWNQYMPYFNDGEECTFSVNETSFLANPELISSFFEHYGIDSEDEEVLLEFLSDEYNFNSFEEPNDYYKEGHVKRQSYNELVERIGSKRVKEIENLLNSYTSLVQTCSDGFKAAFGEHSKITVTRKGTEINIQVEEYDHD
jgi:hypothetical protein